MPDQDTQTNTTTPEQALSQSALLEAAKVAESKAWYRLELEGRRIADEIETLRAERDKLQDDWAKKYGEVKRLSKLHSSNAKGDSPPIGGGLNRLVR